jgi:hypothetical protein
MEMKQECLCNGLDAKQPDKKSAAKTISESSTDLASTEAASSLLYPEAEFAFSHSHRLLVGLQYFQEGPSWPDTSATPRLGRMHVATQANPAHIHI